MKNKKFVLTVLLCCGLLLLSPAQSALALTNSGTWLGTFSGNDNDLESVYNNIIASTSYTGEAFLLSDFDFYAKVDEPSTTTTEGSGSLTIGYEPDGLSGTWEAGVAIDFYTVKGGTSYALYWENPASSAGTWSTEHLALVGSGNIPQISHFSAFVKSSTPVPEPSTILLLGLGLVGLAGIGRKKIKS